jgi:uncharacterized membrane protein YukC
VSNRWVIRKSHEKWTVIIYSIVGLIIVVALVTYMNYAMYSRSSSNGSEPQAALLARF